MSDILETIAAYTKERIAQKKEQVPLKILEKRIDELDITKNYPFKTNLQTDGMSFICECKKASPSKGIIAEKFPYLQIAKDYEKAGANCLSVLTEPKWFLGKDEYIKEITTEVSVPCIRKDFTVDEYMIYEAKALGASAVLLICSLLDKDTIKAWLHLTHELGMSALVETHNETEMDMALSLGAGIVGVNNRNLKDFTVDVGNSGRLRSMVPKEVVFVAESGIKSREDVARLEEIGADAILIGETLMRAADKKAMLDYLKGKGPNPND